MNYCVSCDMPLDEWTPGCKSCRERHRARARRSGDAFRLRRYHALARESWERAWQDTARRVRDGEFHDRLARPRGEGGRWVAAR